MASSPAFRTSSGNKLSFSTHTRLSGALRLLKSSGVTDAPLDIRALLQRARLLVAALLFRLLSQQEDEPSTNAVPNCVYPLAILDGVCVLVLRCLNDLAQDAHDLVRGDTGQPHVDNEGLDDPDGLELDLLDDGGGGVGDGRG
ncbi:hypothetical protein VCV18_008213 [Metarhizium anisopliae]